ncbi:MAG: bacterioferritin [Gemmatimonadota bacterium]|jgi:bacterioferritin
MQGDPKVIEQLNKALREELTAVNQYFVHAEMSFDWGYNTRGTHMKQQSIDEMKHAEALIERLLFLETTPTMALDALTIGDSVKKQIENDLALELGAVKSYNDAIRIAREAGDNVSRELFEHNLEDEEEHVDWLEAQLHLISEVGYERYLSQQMEGEAD